MELFVSVYTAMPYAVCTVESKLQYTDTHVVFQLVKLDHVYGRIKELLPLPATRYHRCFVVLKIGISF